MYLFVLSFVILLYVLFDVDYFVRTMFIVVSGRLFKRRYRLNDVTTIYGICTIKDCDAWLRNVGVARLLREIDFARFHFYIYTGIYERSRQLKIRSLQGCTFTVYEESIPIFALYRINTKLVYWDRCSLFFEHEVITLHDNRLRHFVISRQHAIGDEGDSADALLAGLPMVENMKNCPTHIKKWLESMQVTSRKLRGMN